VRDTKVQALVASSGGKTSARHLPAIWWSRRRYRRSLRFALCLCLWTARC
jgi:hypothetical protein